MPLHDGVTLFMPAYLEDTDQLGMKMVSVFSRNLEQGLPIINAIVTLVDAETGVPTALIDGTYLTALRTGAASGAATELLAKRDARTAAIFGTGVQGRTQLQAVCTVRPIDRVLVFDTRKEAAEKFRAEMAEAGPPIPERIEVASTAKRGGSRGRRGLHRYDVDQPRSSAIPTCSRGPISTPSAPSRRRCRSSPRRRWRGRFSSSIRAKRSGPRRAT